MGLVERHAAGDKRGLGGLDGRDALALEGFGLSLTGCGIHAGEAAGLVDVVADLLGVAEVLGKHDEELFPVGGGFGVLLMIPGVDGKERARLPLARIDLEGALQKRTGLVRDHLVVRGGRHVGHVGDDVGVVRHQTVDLAEGVERLGEATHVGERAREHVPGLGVVGRLLQAVLKALDGGHHVGLAVALRLALLVLDGLEEGGVHGVVAA